MRLRTRTASSCDAHRSPVLEKSLARRILKARRQARKDLRLRAPLRKPERTMRFRPARWRTALIALAFLASSPEAATADPDWPAEGIRPPAFQAALAAMAKHRAEITNLHIMAIIDFGLPSSEPRLFVLERDTGKVMSYLVAHGVGSDPGHTGLATKFSNERNSRASSIGAYLTGEPYEGEHGHSLRLRGLDPTNDNAEARAIVIHGANYVIAGTSLLGRSWGCPAVEPRYVRAIVDELRGGALLFVYAASDLTRS
jgi:L,D-transpeptidase catalytic domain